MKSWWLGALALVVAVGLAPSESEAKRLGGGGMQRSLPTRTAPDSTPAKPAQAPNQATPAQQAAPAPAAAAAGKRSWLGPIAGLAAGLGIAAMLSHFGLGEAFANGLMMVLLVLVAVFAIMWLVRRFGRGKGTAATQRGSNPFQPAYAGAGNTGGTSSPSSGLDHARNQVSAFTGNAAAGSAAASFGSGSAAQTAATPALDLPADFDRSGFERIAKLIFIRMQAANDRSDLDDLRNFTTPEMFASIRLDLQSRGNVQQTTDVVQVDAEVIDLVREDGRDIVSVRYHGLICEEAGQPTAPFDEVWHLVRPTDASREWAIAGIQSMQ
jgi:predicted lipid-binding transport protein (Tim44 family)